MTNAENANVLAHHGILGQKWGVRRYQNKDGSYTAAGEKHRQKEETINKLKKQADKIDRDSKYGKVYAEWKKKNPKADEDDFGDYLADKHPNLEMSSKSQKLRSDAYKMSDGYVRNHHGVKGQKWGVKNGPPYPLHKFGSGDKLNENAPSNLNHHSVRKPKFNVKVIAEKLNLSYGDPISPDESCKLANPGYIKDKENYYGRHDDSY